MRFVSFHARIDRPTFFASMVVLYVLGIVFVTLAMLGTLALALDIPAQDIPESLRGMRLPTSVGWVCLIVGLPGFLWIVLGTIGVSVRRLHDIGLTGFLVLVFPLLKHMAPDPGWPDWLPGPVDILWVLILSAQPGTRGANAFGPDPHASTAEPAETAGS